mmetsp:Transcript_10781/g.26016  ORF Transcript_10781/g.26016 Transcript_10781/m.26016 type:complete len:229 (+) Transcript_10781:157-843(+)
MSVLPYVDGACDEGARAWPPPETAAVASPPLPLSPLPALSVAPTTLASLPRRRRNTTATNTSGAPSAIATPTAAPTAAATATPLSATGATADGTTAPMPSSRSHSSTELTIGGGGGGGADVVVTTSSAGAMHSGSDTFAPLISMAVVAAHSACSRAASSTCSASSIALRAVVVAVPFAAAASSTRASSTCSAYTRTVRLLSCSTTTLRSCTMCELCGSGTKPNDAKRR